MNTAAYDCARLYKSRKGKNSSTTLKQVVDEYAEEMNESSDAIYRRLMDHPEEWKI